jgi:hypothetical protein
MTIESLMVVYGDGITRTSAEQATCQPGRSYLPAGRAILSYRIERCRHCTQRYAVQADSRTTVGKQIAVVAAAVAVAVIPVPPALVERFYSGQFYPLLQPAITSTSNRLPVALFDILLVAAGVAWLALAIRDAGHDSLVGAAVRMFVRTMVWGAALYLLFLAVWGLNYRRLRLADRVPFDQSAVTADAARMASLVVVARLNALTDSAHHEGFEANAGDDPALSDAFTRALSGIGLERAVVVGRPKHTLLDWYFRRAGVDGMTDPFFLETLVARSILPFERPFVVAHEWSHLAGIANEGDANFVGWIACMNGSIAHQYSGWLFLYGELARTIGARERAALAATLAPGPRGDLQAIRDRFEREVNPKVSDAGWRVYDTYLKANRVQEGAASYADVVRLVLGARLPENPLAKTP